MNITDITNNNNPTTVNSTCVSHEGRGTYTAGTVNSVPFLTVARKSVDFPRHF